MVRFNLIVFFGWNITVCLQLHLDVLLTDLSRRLQWRATTEKRVRPCMRSGGEFRIETVPGINRPYLEIWDYIFLLIDAANAIKNYTL